MCFTLEYVMDERNSSLMYLPGGVQRADQAAEAEAGGGRSGEPRRAVVRHDF
jgi:hypothetical protein